MTKIDRFDGTEYDFLSNFYIAPIVYMGKEYKTVEHLFQAMKASTEKERERIRLVPNPGSAKRFGNQAKLRIGWEEIKDTIMFQACLCKFLQHVDLAQKLFSTGDAFLEEGNTWGDQYWGTVDGVGKNMLGKILMRVRDIIQGK
jgi:ribA/ribD-fused uncharacterized protein